MLAASGISRKFIARHADKSASPGKGGPASALRVVRTASTPFSEDFEAGNSFTLVNGSANNSWVAGTAAGGAQSSARGLHISNNGGAAYAYSGNNNGQRSQVHAYADVALPAGETSITLSFDWKNTGESNFDYLRVSYAPTTFTPTAVSNATLGVGTPISGTGTGSPTVLANNLTGQAAFGSLNITLPASLAGSTVRLIFTWANDGADVFNPPAAIDNVVVTSLPPSPLCGTRTVGPGGDFSSLTSAFASLTANGLCGPLVLELLSSYVSSAETFPLVFDYAGTTSANTVTVRPQAGASGLQITSAASQTLSISGSSHFILDGRPGGSGTTLSGAATATDLAVANTSTTGIPLLFTNDATFNTVQHCRIIGVGGTETYPNVSFSATAGTVGNSDNTIRFNTIGSGITTPTALVYSGSSSNTHNTIEGNELLNFYNSANNGYGIYLSAAGPDWTISGNSLYWTAARNGDGGSILFGIYVASGGGGITIAGNFIGGTAPNAGGTPLTISGAPVAYRFRGISLNGTGTAATIENNTIANFAWLSSSGATTAPGVWAGMYLQSNASVVGNTIGGSAGGVTVTTSTTNGISYGIVASAAPSVLNIAQNTISNLTAAGNTAPIAASIAGIQVASPDNTVARNKIHSLQAGNNGVATGIISLNGSPTISNNLIGDLQAPASGNLLAVAGLTISGGTVADIYHNTIYLNASSTATSFGSSGIYVASATTLADLRNNIVVNASTPGSGSGLTVALRRSTTDLSGYAGSSDHNLYYAGTPAPNRLLYHDGTNSDQTLAAFKARVAPRETSSVSEDVPFASTDGSNAAFLHINPSVITLVESGGTAIAGLTDDYDATGSRPAGSYPLAGQTNGGGTAPDLGADEGDFTAKPVVNVGIADLTAPAASQTCYSATEAVTVLLQNFASTPLDFGSHPVTVSGTITAPGFTTITLPTQVISWGSLGAYASLPVTFPGTYDLSAVNTYTFNITATTPSDTDPSNDALPGTPAGTNTRVVQPLAAGTAAASPAALCGAGTTTLSLTGNTGGNVQWQYSTDNLTFTDISGATDPSYATGTLTQTTYFRAVVSCGAATQTSNVVTVTVSSPQVASVNAPTRCGPGTVTLQAMTSAGDTPYYYSTATGGAPFASGSTATVAVSASQTFYVEARTGTLNVAGETSNTSAPGGSVFQQSTFSDYALGFNVSAAGTLSSVDVYPTAAGTLTIRLHTATNPGAGTPVAGTDRSFTITAGQVGTRVTLPLNYPLAAGGYKLVNAAGGLGRYSTYTGSYPLTNGALSVVGSYNFSYSTTYTNTTYNHFFNLAFAPGGAGCVSAPRTALSVTVTPAPALTPAASAATICSGTSTSITYANYANLTVSPGTGATVSGQTVTFNPTTTTTYTITGNDGTGPSGCSATATATITVNPAPNAPTLTPAAPGPICAGTSTAVTASSNPSTVTNYAVLPTATFDSGADGFTTTSTGSQAGSGFVRVAAGYLRGTANTAYNGPSGAATGGYFISDSDKYGTGATAPSTQTTLTSPAFSTVNVTAATLSFQQYYRQIASDAFAGVEYSTNGTTWVLLASYTATQGAGTGTEAATSLALPAAALGQPSVRVRFRYQTNDGWYWAVDNVGISGTLNDVPTFAVTPTAGASVSGSTITFNPSTTTTYSVTARYPSTGCTSPATPLTITVTPRPTAAFTATATTLCANSGTTLTGTLTGTAPFAGQYRVNGGAAQTLNITGNTFSIATGPLTTTSTFTISALTGAGCSATTLPAASATVTVNQRPTFTISNVTNVNCTGSSTGSITVAASGGLTPYRYSRDNGATYQTSSTFSNLPAGTYQILVRSNSGAQCTAVASQSVTITQPTNGVAVSETHTNVSCTNASDGTITATGSLGAGSYRYSLDNGASYFPATASPSPYTFTGLAAGTYTVLVLDANGCTASTPAILITTNPRPTATLSNNGPLCAGNPATITVSLTGTAPWSFTYTNGTTPVTVSNITTSPYVISVPQLLATTTYSVTSLNDNFCSGAGAGLGSTTVTVNTTTTWTGAAPAGDETNWFNAANWTNCVPTRFVNAVIPNGLPSYPELLTSATAEVNTLIVNNSASLYMSAGELHIYGNLNNSGILDLAPMDGVTGFRTGGVLAFMGATPHMINGLSEVLNLTFNTGGVTTLNTDLSVFSSLTMTSGVLNTGSNTVTLRDIQEGPYSTALLTETETSYVLGQVAVIRDLDAPGLSDSFNGLGLTLTTSPTSTTMPGITQVTRTTGSPALGVNNNESVLRRFRIIPQNDGTLDIAMSFGYFSHERNGIADGNLMLFSRDVADTGAMPWMYYRASLGTATPPDGTSPGAVPLNGISTLAYDWTLGSSLAPLPVELTRFTATRDGGNARLEWTTASEQDNRGFEVQVSSDGQRFAPLGFVEGQGSTASPTRYAYSDRQAGKQGLRYYRLKQVDNDGSYAFSPVRTVAFEPATASLSAAPNPFRAELTATVSSTAAERGALWWLTDATGRSVRQERADLPAGSSQLSLSGLDQLPAGVYVLHIKLQGKVLHTKVVKE